MITLRPAEHLVTPGLSNLYPILPRQLERGFDCFRSAASEVHGASPKILSGNSSSSRVLFRDRSGELAGVSELQLRQLLGHGSSDFGDSVSDEVHRRGAGKIQVALAFCVPEVNAFAADGGEGMTCGKNAEKRRSERVRSSVESGTLWIIRRAALQCQNASGLCGTGSSTRSGRATPGEIRSSLRSCAWALGAKPSPPAPRNA